MNGVKVRRQVDVEIVDLGERIKQARKANGKPVEVLAQAAGISRMHWYDIENEKLRDALPEATLRKIEQVLGVEFGVRFDGQSQD